MEEARRSLLASLLLALAGLLLLTACSSAPRLAFVSEDHSYTLAEVDKMAPTVAAGAAGKVALADATGVRQRVLSKLRGNGRTASEAADFMTRQFPPVTPAVPYYVESAKVDGHACWIILETWGPKSGTTLDRRRLWVFDREDGSVLDARTYR
jgi:hypothetical protein